ncbi:MAG: response regulator [Saprospiraceae bacterium]|nr:response regulator [Saprospiraceae bacterium]
MVEIILLEDNELEATLFESAIQDLDIATRLHIVPDEKGIKEKLDQWNQPSNGNTFIIFLDMYTPEKTGLEILEEIKSHPVFPVCDVVMLTGLSDEKVIQKAYQQGIQAYLNKPIDYEELVNLTQGVINFFSLPRQQ